MPSFVPHQVVDGVECKRCCKCKSYKPLDDFIKSAQHKDGLRPVCGDCRKVEKRAEYDKHRSEYIKRARKFYHDNIDEGREKRVAYRETHREETYATNQKWRETHKEEKRLMDRRYRENNKEKVALRVRKYMSTPEGKISHKLRNQRYLATENGNLTRQLSRQRYRNRSEAVSSTLTKIQWNACKRFFGHTCAYCGKPLKNLTQDHFIPLSDGGGYDVDNIIPCCKSCNSSKQNQNFFLWYHRQPFFSEQRKARVLEYLALF